LNCFARKALILDDIARTLMSLQDLDQVLARQKHQYISISKELDLQGGISIIKEKVEKARMMELESKVEIAKIESEVSSLESKSSELEEKLYSGIITNIRELTAIETEYARVKQSLEELKKKIDSARSKIDEISNRYETMNQNLVQKKDAWEKVKGNLVQEKSVLGKKYNKRLKERNVFAESIPEDFMRDYIRLFRSNRGVAIVRVTKGICQGCLVKLPVGDLEKMKFADSPVLCNSGRHFLTE